jgi:hypothetical protein
MTTKPQSSKSLDELAAEFGAECSASPRDKFDIGKLAFKAGHAAGKLEAAEEIKKLRSLAAELASAINRRMKSDDLCDMPHDEDLGEAMNEFVNFGLERSR